MSRRTSLTVPVIEHHKGHRRCRSADDRSSASSRAPTKPVPRPAFVPGAYPLSSDEDEEDHVGRSSPQPVQQVKIRNDATRPRSSSARMSRAKLPATPESKRPQLQDSASDPGHLSPRRTEGLDDRPIPHRQGHSLPCGRQYKSLNGYWSRTHQAKCIICCPDPNEDDIPETRSDRSAGGGEEVATPQRYAESYVSLDDYDEGTSAVVDDTDLEDIQRVPDQDSTHLSAQIVHLSLIREAKLDLTKEETEGIIYILRDPKRDGVLKIGRSSDPEKRHKRHKQKCGASMVCVFASNRVKNVKRVERLAHTDLKHLGRSWKCERCSEEHREWFEVEEETAKEIVRKWIKWINEQDPYRGGTLEPLWGYLMDWGRVPNPELEPKDHIGRWDHWNKVLSPVSKADRENFEAHVAGVLQENSNRGARTNKKASPKNVKLSMAPGSPLSKSYVQNVASNSRMQFQHAHFYGTAYINQHSEP